MATSPLRCLILSRATLISALHDGDPSRHLDSSGVYLLLGPPDAKAPHPAVKPQAYIGQADGVDIRLEQHLNDYEKEWFNFAFVLRLEELHPFNISQLREIESTLCRRAETANICNLKNKNMPQGALLAAAEQEAVKTFVEHAVIMFTALNLDFFSESALPLPEQKSAVRSMTKREPAPSAAMKPIVDEIRAMFTETAFPGARWYPTFTPDYRVKVVMSGEERTFLNIRLAKQWLRVDCRGNNGYKGYFKVASSADLATHRGEITQAYSDAKKYLESD